MCSGCSRPLATLRHADAPHLVAQPLVRQQLDAVGDFRAGALDGADGGELGLGAVHLAGEDEFVALALDAEVADGQPAARRELVFDALQRVGDRIGGGGVRRGGIAVQMRAGAQRDRERGGGQQEGPGSF